MRTVAPAICFTSQEGLFDAEGLAGGFGGWFRPAAGGADPDREQNIHYTEILTVSLHSSR